MNQRSTRKTLLAIVLVIIAAICVGCVSPAPTTAQPSPSPSSGGCGRLGDLASICGKTLTVIQVGGGDTNWASLPALRLTVSVTPGEGAPYVAFDTGINDTTTPVDVSSDQIVPTGQTAVTTAGHATGTGAEESAREAWVVDFTAGTIQWTLSTDQSQLTLRRGNKTIVVSTKA